MTPSWNCVSSGGKTHHNSHRQGNHRSEIPPWWGAHRQMEVDRNLGDRWWHHTLSSCSHRSLDLQGGKGLCVITDIYTILFTLQLSELYKKFALNYTYTPFPCIFRCHTISSFAIFFYFFLFIPLLFFKLDCLQAHVWISKASETYVCGCVCIYACVCVCEFQGCRSMTLLRFQRKKKNLTHPSIPQLSEIELNHLPQWTERQSSHSHTPVKWLEQVQVYPLSCGRHVPPFWHGME